MPSAPPINCWALSGWVFRTSARVRRKTKIDGLRSQYFSIRRVLIFLTCFTVTVWKVNNFHIMHSLNSYANGPMSKIMITFLAHLNNEIIYLSETVSIGFVYVRFSVIILFSCNCDAWSMVFWFLHTIYMKTDKEDLFSGVAQSLYYTVEKNLRKHYLKCTF